MQSLQVLAEIALDLTKALSASDRYQRLLRAWHRAVPFDAAALLRLEDGALRPLAAEGLKGEALARRYVLREHPRLQIICASTEPVRFPADTGLPDPFDGLLVNDGDALGHVHACLGCPLRVDDVLVGALTADALAPDAFAGVDGKFLAAVAALAGAALHTTRLIETLEHTAAQQGLIARDLMRDLELRQGSQLIGVSPAMQRLRSEIELVARSDFTVLITGESGVGKELVARALHAASARREAALIYVNCAALPETLAESELFGHVRGAFTGAIADRAGKFEVADGGTLLLDEIGELPLTIQPKLLRALQQGEIQRVGSDAARRVDVRLLAATNRDLDAEVRAGRFRADLFHRLNVYPLRVPPLRERGDDIPLLAGFFCDVTRRRLGIGPVRLAPDALAALATYAWPGNVRELENVLSRVTLKAAASAPRGAAVLIDAAQLGADFGSGAAAAAVVAAPPAPARATLSLRQATVEFQRERIRRALAEHDGNWAAAARALGMHRSNLHHLATRLGVRVVPR
ncbi:MAG: nitric oxide reductase transcriptional regulator NorR [Deltaproteobacteria bacterium]|nr:nitric oxide reductase transcriptional regulator NorR [Deltaproteobacteria bacterium]